MFGIGPLELALIALVAVVFIGPNKLPDAMRALGKFFVQTRRYTNDIRSQVQSIVDEAENELRVEELEKLRHQLKNVSPTQLVENAIGPLEEAKEDLSLQHSAAVPVQNEPAAPLTPAKTQEELDEEDRRHIGHTEPSPTVQFDDAHIGHKDKA